MAAVLFGFCLYRWTVTALYGCIQKSW